MTNAEKFEKAFGFDINYLFVWDSEKYFAWANKSISDEKTVLAEVQVLKKEIAELNEAHREELNSKTSLIRYRDGMIDGLKFALRCNGVSGGEV